MTRTATVLYYVAMADMTKSSRRRTRFFPVRINVGLGAEVGEEVNRLADAHETPAAEIVRRVFLRGWPDEAHRLKRELRRARRKDVQV